MKLKLLITSCAFAFLYMGNVEASRFSRIAAMQKAQPVQVQNERLRDNHEEVRRDERDVRVEDHEEEEEEQENEEAPFPPITQQQLDQLAVLEAMRNPGITTLQALHDVPNIGLQDALMQALLNPPLTPQQQQQITAFGNVEGANGISDLLQVENLQLQPTLSAQLNKANIQRDPAHNIPDNLYQDVEGLHIAGEGFGAALKGILNAENIAGAVVHLDSALNLLNVEGITAIMGGIPANNLGNCASRVATFRAADLANRSTLGYLRIIKEIITAGRGAQLNQPQQYQTNMDAGVFSLLKDYICDMINVSTDVQLVTPQQHGEEGGGDEEEAI